LSTKRQATAYPSAPVDQSVAWTAEIPDGAGLASIEIMPVSISPLTAAGKETVGYLRTMPFRSVLTARNDDDEGWLAMTAYLTLPPASNDEIWQGLSYLRG